MQFSEDVVKKAFERASGQCECKKRTHAHFYIPCGKHLVWSKRGVDGREGWQAHPIDLMGGEILSNCEILCSECGSV